MKSTFFKEELEEEIYVNQAPCDERKGRQRFINLVRLFIV
jgi:hypothetical protein